MSDLDDKAKNRPTIGVALSGGSGRAIAHIGVLEVLKEYDIPVDYITACSSGTIVAGSFAAGTMEKLKNDWLKWNKKFIFGLLGVSKTEKGLLSTEKMAESFRQYFDEKFEDVSPRLGFVCVDVLTGQPVLLSLGDIVKAGQASCAAPGLFEPVEWGNRLLVDGGLVSLVPVAQAREMGADIVIGVDIAATRHIYKKRYIHAWRGYNFVKQTLPARMLRKTFSLVNRLYESSLKLIFYNQSDFFEESLIKDSPDLFSVMAKALDIASEQHKNGRIPTCDIMLSPNVKQLGKMDFESSKQAYLEGRRVALEAVPRIQNLIGNFKKHDNN